MLLLYQNVTPNIDDSVHYLCDYKVLKAKLVSNLLQQVQLSTYEINSNIIKVALSKNITIENYKTITYAINELTGICYFVKDSEVRSNFVILYCEVDLRGTYIDKAQIKNIHVTKCNRLVGTGYFNEPTLTKDFSRLKFDIPLESQVDNFPMFMKYEDVYVVFLLEYNVKANVSGVSTANDLFACSLQEIYNKVNSKTVNKYTEINPLILMTGVIGGIHAIKPFSREARVSKVYVVPKQFIQFNTSDKYGTVCLSDNRYDPDIEIKAYKVLYDTVEFTKEVSVDANYNYYIGTIFDGIKIDRINKPVKITYTAISNINGLQIIVSQGENQKDITTSFQSTVTTNNSQINSLDKMTGIFNSILTSLVTTAGSLATGNATGSVTGGISTLGTIGSIFTNNRQVLNHNQIAGGEALANYYTEANATKGLGVVFPLGYTRYRSVNDELMSAQREGLNFDIYFDNIYDIFSYDFVKNDRQFGYTYLKCSADISAIPLVAINLIKSKLNKGIYLQWI